MLKDKRLFLFDIDGTLGVGDELYEGSAELISHIRQIGGQSIFITNNSTKNRQDYVEKFAKWGIETEISQFVTSGFLMAEYLKRYYLDAKIYVMGTRSFTAELRAQGLQVTAADEQGIGCVVIGYDDELTYEKITTTCRILSLREVPFLATNPDLCCPAPFGFIPDCGAICQMIESSVSKTPLYIGKPSEAVVAYCLEHTGFSRAETLVVGDRLYTDIACGINGGVDTYLVFSGEANVKDLKETSFPPAFYGETIQNLYEEIKLP